MKRSPFQQLKDTALEQGLLMFLRPRFERYGELLSLSVDTQAKVLSAEVRLRGEEKPVQLRRARYRVENCGADTNLVLHDILISKEWAQCLVDDHFPEIRLKIPPVVQKLIG